jgi:hypothetical protein
VGLQPEQAPELQPLQAPELQSVQHCLHGAGTAVGEAPAGLLMVHIPGQLETVTQLGAVAVKVWMPWVKTVAEGQKVTKELTTCVT